MASPEKDDKSGNLETGDDDDLSDNLETGDDDEDGDSPKRPQLTASASVPSFPSRGIEDDRSDLAAELGGSETDLDRKELNQNALHLAQSYAGKYQEHRNHHDRDQAQQKVHFTNIPSPSHHVTFSPVRRSRSRSPSFDQRSPIKKKKRLRTFSENSTNLSMNSSVTSVTTNTDSYTAPDGGFGWVVVVASFLTNMIADGVTFSFGIMFEEFQLEFSSSSAVTAGVVSVFHAVPLLTGPIATWLADRYGCRAVTIWGSVLASTGFFAAAFSHHIALLYFFFGVVSGFGLSLVYVASIIIVAYYFESRRSFATGIAVSGSGIGTFLFAPFTQWLMDNYGGWRGACIILSGIFLNMILCGLMFRELEWKKRISRASSARSISSQMPEIEELRKALENGDVSELITDKKHDEMIASSLVTIPTYIKDINKLPQDILAMMVQNKQTYDFLLENYPDCLKDIQSVESFPAVILSEEKHSCQTKPTNLNGESKRVKLRRRVSSLMKGQHSILKKEQQKVDIQKLKIRRQSMTYHGAIVSIRNRLRSTSCPDIYKNTMSEDDNDEKSCYGEISETFEDCFSFDYITLPFIVFCLSNFLLYFWYDVPYVYTIEYVENNLNIPNTESTRILSIIGILNTIGEVIVGWLSDQKWVSSIFLYMVCMLVCGLVTAIIPFLSSFPAILSLSATYGFCIAANYSLTSPILIDLVSIHQFSAAYGVLLAAQGIGNLIGPPFAGWLYDYSKQWYLTFGLCGLFIAISGLCLLIIPAIMFFKRSKTFKLKTEKSESYGDRNFTYENSQFPENV